VSYYFSHIITKVLNLRKRTKSSTCSSW